MQHRICCRAHSKKLQILRIEHAGSTHMKQHVQSLEPWRNLNHFEMACCSWAGHNGVQCCSRFHLQRAMTDSDAYQSLRTCVPVGVSKARNNAGRYFAHGQ